MNLGQILQKTTTDRYGERDIKYKWMLDEMALFLGGSERPTGMPFVLKSIPYGSKVLEFGPASGYMTRYLKEELGCEITIVELDSDCAASASVYADKCFIGNIDDMGWAEWLEGEQFDIITFCDVLEHLREPWKILKKVVEHLKEDGSVLCSIPNVAHHTVVARLLENEFEYFSCGLLDITHLRFFTSRSLMDMFDYCELAVASEGNTKMTEVFPESACPWTSGTKNPVLGAFQKNLSKRASYQVFQYVVELKRSTWMEKHHVEKLNLNEAEQLASETDFCVGQVWEEEERRKEELTQKWKSALCERDELKDRSEEAERRKEELTQKWESALCERDELKGRLDIAAGALKVEKDQLEKILSSREIKIWNRCVKMFSLFLILPRWRRTFRRKHTIK